MSKFTGGAHLLLGLLSVAPGYEGRLVCFWMRYHHPAPSPVTAVTTAINISGTRGGNLFVSVGNLTSAHLAGGATPTWLVCEEGRELLRPEGPTPRW